MVRSTRPATRVCALIMVALAAVACGDDDEAAAPTASFPKTLPTIAPILTAGEADRAAPRWEQLANFSGTGPLQTPPFTVIDRALQWRVNWSCDSGALRISTDPPPPKPNTVDATCPGQGNTIFPHSGELRLNVEASGPWRAVVEQQVDTPINEAPLPGMESAPVLLKGQFYDVEKKGAGTASVYQLPDGRRALRLSEDFRVFNNTDLVVWLSEVPMPKTSAEAANAPYVEIAPLKATRGPQNYIIPDDLPTERIRSVALWCVPVPSVYLAAALS